MARSKTPNPAKKWNPASPEWVHVFTGETEKMPGAEQRKMFGYPAAFVNGNLFAGLHERGLVLRLRESDREACLKIPGAKQFEPMPGRPMKEYIVVPETLAARPAEVQAWLAKAFAYGATLPPKSRAAKKTKPRASRA